MLICFEGPSAIGKTTMCKSLSSRFNIIPEANELFIRTLNEEKTHYLNLQLRRYEKSLQTDLSSILDGDIFQPLWYNWTYNFPPNYQSLNELKSFYTDKISSGKLKFPDLYIIFKTDIEIIKSRKINDAARSRRNFDTHLKLIDSQKKYFDFVSQNTTINVETIDYDNFENAKESVLKKISQTTPKEKNDLQNFRLIADWLGNNQNF